MQHTQHYDLNQYEPGDHFLRTDFNGDNAKLDAALKALDDKANAKAAQTALDATNASLAGLTTKVNGKADQSALNSLTTKVNAKAEQSALNTTNTNVANLSKNKADVTALNALTTKVNGKAEQSALNTVQALAASKCRVIFGTYIGDGTEGRTIQVGGKPLAILLETTGGARGSNLSSGGLYLSTKQQTVCQLTDTGFTVGVKSGSGVMQMNSPNASYFYAAFLEE